MIQNMEGELTIMDSMGIKPNYAQLGKKYGLDWRTVKKYHEGYKGKPKTREKPSRLDKYKAEILDKLSIKRTTMKGVHEFLIDKYGISEIGTYSNFAAYIRKNKLKPERPSKGHPRYETPIGKQAQIDWKEDIVLTSERGESFTVNIFHAVLGFSRMSYLELSVHKRTEDLFRCLINAFRTWGGVPEELLFDNMATVAVTGKGPKRLTSSIKRFAADFGFNARLCRIKTPETKGIVEARNKILDWIRPYDHEFKDLEDLTDIVTGINEKMNITINQGTGMSPVALFYREKEYLRQLPSEAVIDQYLCPNRYTVPNDALILYAGSKYSVSPELINREVTVDSFDNKLYIYYNGKLAAFHVLNNNPVNYKPEHYTELMKGKVKDTDLEAVVKENLKLMDTLLENRKAVISPVMATRSAEALIAYINQSEYGKWVVNNYASLNAADKLTFIKGMNQVLPYVSNTKVFLERLKFSMKDNLCRTVDFDCLVNDYMAVCSEEVILTDEGYHELMEKYDRELHELLEDMRRSWSDEESTDGTYADFMSEDNVTPFA